MKTTKTKSVASQPKAPKAPRAPRAKVAQSSKPLAHGVGRRKSSVARVWLRPGKGAFMVNGKEFSMYFDTVENRLAATSPRMIYPQAAQEFDIEANVVGGGMNSQADAVKLGIARALIEIREEARQALRDNGLLTVDSRVKERKKYGQPGARRKFQFVKR